MFLFSHSNLCPSTILKYLSVDLNLIVLKFCLQARAGAIPSEQLRLQPKKAALFLAPEMIVVIFFLLLQGRVHVGIAQRFLLCLESF